MRYSKLSVLLLVGLFAVLAMSALAKDEPELAKFQEIVIPEDGLFPFHVNLTPSDNATNLTAWPQNNQKPAGKDGFIRCVGGHFVNDAGPIRFLGTSITGNSCFPETDEEAQALAKHLSRFGFNLVRCHFMDIFCWTPKNNNDFDPVKLEALDRLVYYLEKEGIYVNLNLHVARKLDERDGFANPGSRAEFDKGIDYLDPEIVKMEKKYARDLLTHKNVRTGLTYAEDPGIAMVELNNENNILLSFYAGDLDNLDSPCLDRYQAMWNAWLRQKYASTEELRKAWESEELPIGEELIPQDAFQKGASLENLPHWKFDADPDASYQAKITENGTLCVEVANHGKKAPTFEFTCDGVSVQKDVIYQLQVTLRSPKAERVDVILMENHEPLKHLFGHSTHPKGEWKSFTYDFKLSRDEENAKILIRGLKENESLEIASLSLRSGGMVGPKSDESLENGTIRPVPQKGLLVTDEMRADTVAFLLEVETNYFKTMRDYIKNDLKVAAPLCGTQTGYGTLTACSLFNFCDTHFYWNHPNFYYRDGIWGNRNSSEVNSMLSNPLSVTQIPFFRTLGYPHTVSEFNHPTPDLYQAEGLPIACALAAFQGIDALDQYNWETNHAAQPTVNENFSISDNPTQIVHVPACWGMLVRGDVAEGKEYLYTRELTTAKEWAQFVTAPHRFNYNMADKNLYGLSLAVRCALDVPDAWQRGEWKQTEKKISSWSELPEEFGSPEKKWIRNETGEFYYDYTREGKGFFTVTTPKTKIFVGFPDGRSFQMGNLELTPGETRLGWLTFSMTQIDDRRTLIAATGLMKNKGQRFWDLENEWFTCYKNWGEAPILCEGIPASLKIKTDGGHYKCYALGEQGERKAEVPVAIQDGKLVVEINSAYQTLWYELVRED